MDKTLLTTLRDQASRELTDNILPFYLDHVIDHKRGGFYGFVANDLTVDENAPKGLIQITRILWTFAQAYRTLHRPAYLACAERAFTYLLQVCRDGTHGGFYWMVDARGKPKQTVKMVYGQAFAVYALAEYARTTGSQESLAQAVALYRLLEQHALDPVQGGYWEARQRNWSPAPRRTVDNTKLPVAKSMNTHLHLLEAYTNLLRAWENGGLRQRLRALIRITLDHLVDRQTGHFILHFDAAWQPLGHHVSYGHDIEGSWLLVEAAEVLGDAQLLAEARTVAVQMAAATLAEGVDGDGGVFNEGSAGQITNAEKDWWPQAEAVVGFLNAFQLTGEPLYLAAAQRTWDFIQQTIVDRQHGEWFWGVTPAGQPRNQQKTGPWKGPYHNGRACMEIMRRVDELLG